MDNCATGNLTGFGHRTLIDKHNFQEAIEFVLRKTAENLEVFKDKFPCNASENLLYYPVKNAGGDTGFWTGMLWLAYEVSGDKRYRIAAEIQLESFKERLGKGFEIDSINIGRVYVLSCVAAYKVTGNEEARNLALRAADILRERYRENVKFIPAIGEPGRQEGSYVEMTSIGNLSLLFWAAAETGDRKYYDIANEHLNQVLKHNIREDGSTVHQFYMDAVTGEPLYGANITGYSNQSCWARGHALGICGIVLGYIYTGDIKLLQLAKKTANYFLSRLPEDGVCYWDLFFIEGEEPRDTSAAVIAASGLLELSRYLPVTDDDKYIYENSALKILNKLMKDYTTNDEEYSDSNGILMGGVYRRPFGYGENECLLIGDYFYLETLIKASTCIRLYW